jgi:hypothetical protein
LVDIQNPDRYETNMHTRSLRLPDDLAAWIRDEAARLGLTENALILILLAACRKRSAKAKS